MLPFAAATAAGALYFSVSLILVSLIADEQQTGYFGASFRVVAVLFALPGLIVGTALPIFARAATDDPERLRFAVQRVIDTTTIFGTLVVLGIFVGARDVVAIIAGPEFGPATEVLQIHCLGLLGSFVTAVLVYALLSLGRHRAILWLACGPLVSNVVLTFALTPSYGAGGAASGDGDRRAHARDRRGDRAPARDGAACGRDGARGPRDRGGRAVRHADARRRRAPARARGGRRRRLPRGPLVARLAPEGPARRPSSAPVRIVIFNPSYPPVACGVGDYTRGLARALTGAGHDVTVVTGANSTAATEGPPQVLPLLAHWGVTAFVRSRSRFAKPRPDLVVSGFPAAVEGRRPWLIYLLPAVAKALLGRPRATFIVHEFVRTGELQQRLLGASVRAADRIVAVTEAERDAIVARYPSVAGRTVVRHNAPSISVAADDLAADAAMRADLAPRARPVIAFFGFIWSEAKGFDDLLEALAHTDAVLVATGSLDPANPYHAHVGAEIERLGLGERVRWLGFLENEAVGRVLRVADAVVLPFRGGAESGYTSLLAALINGAAVVTTRGPENPPWLRDDDTALLVEPAAPDQLAGAIDRLLADAELAARLRAGGRALSFGWEEIVEAVLAPAELSSRGR